MSRDHGPGQTASSLTKMYGRRNEHVHARRRYRQNGQIGARPMPRKEIVRTPAGGVAASVVLTLGGEGFRPPGQGLKPACILCPAGILRPGGVDIVKEGERRGDEQPFGAK